MSKYYSTLLNVLTPAFSNTYSMAFDGVDDFMSYSNSWFAPSTPSQSTGNSVGSFSCWFKTSNWATSPFSLEGILSFTVGSQAKPLLWAMYRGNATQGNRYLRFYFRGSDGAGGTTGQEQFFVYDNASATYGGSGISFANDTWYHLALVFDKDATNRVTVYINGNQFLIPNTTTGSGTAGTRTISSGGLPHSLPYNPLSTGIYPSGEIACVRTSSTARTYHSPINLDELSLYDYALTSANVTSIYNGGVPNDVSSLSPIAWYRMGENGSWKSPQWLLPQETNKDKVSNYSFEFDGVDDVITLDATFDATGGLTFSCWIKYTSASAGSLNWLCSNGGIGGSGSQFNIRLIADGRWFMYFNGSPQDTGITGLNDGNWHHIAQTVNYSNGDVKFYKDGSESSTVLTWGSTYSTAILKNIGGANSTPAYPYGGFVDELSVFESIVDIATLYNSGTPTTLPSGAVAHYKMGEDATFSTNWTVPDAVGSNDGTSANMTIEDRVGEAPNSSNNSLSYNMDEVDREADVPS